MKKNYALDFLKVFSMIVIIIHHSSLIYKWMPHGHVFVELFFFTSGFFLYATYKKYSEMTVFQYVKNRIAKLYPYYIIAFVLLSGWQIVITEKLQYKSILDGILEAVMFPTTFVYDGSAINAPVWYLSVLITASPIIYALLRKVPRKVFNISAIAVIVAVYAYLVYNGSLECWKTVFVFVMPWWRGFADLLICVLIYQLVEICKPKITASPWWSIPELFFFTGTICTLFIKPRIFDFLSVFFIIGLIISVTMHSVVFDRIGETKALKFLARYEYIAYINHILIISLVNLPCRVLGIPIPVRIILLLIGTLIYSVVFKFVADKLLDLPKKSILKRSNK